MPNHSEKVDPADLDAAAAAALIADGQMTSLELVEACLARIEAREPDVQAWAHLDPEFAREQAKHCDEQRRSGRPVGPLHGVPVGIKDVFDTRSWPTENGTAIDDGRQPTEDAHVIALLQQAGAVIMGKTVTTELAVYSPGKTRNPHDPAHTPGGSSSGSAAAVASGMVPLAIGTQTNGSVIRPASYCGVFGFKPTHGRISRRGVLQLSPTLDHVGVFARTISDAALLAEALMGYDPGDDAMQPRAPARLVATADAAPPATPQLVFVETPAWPQADATTQEAFGELVDTLGDLCDRDPLPPPFDSSAELLKRVMNVDLAHNLNGYYERAADSLSDTLRGMIEEGRETHANDYLAALDWREVLGAGLDKVFDRYDAILTPATTGTAPKGMESTGSPAFCSLWSFLGVPAISLPLLIGEDGLPLGVQLVGRRGDDARLLRTARWLIDHLSQLADAEPESTP